MRPINSVNENEDRHRNVNSIYLWVLDWPSTVKIQNCLQSRDEQHGTMGVCDLL